MDCWRSIVEGWLLKASLILVNFLISSKKKPKQVNSLIKIKITLNKINTWVLKDYDSKPDL
jgi:hypothetical protein